MDVDEIVRQVDVEQQLKRNLITVKKLIEVEYDVGNLLTYDQNLIDERSLKSSECNQYLKSLARDNVQLLVTKLWELPTERVEEVIIAKLPNPTTRLPREKPLPTARKQTKWENFAKMKGIQKKKKGRMIWDDELKKWIPRWGYKSKDETKDWVIEVPDQADPFEDQFGKRIQAKKERVSKNELQRLRNLARNSKGKVPGVGIMPTKSPAEKEDLKLQMIAAKKSTASMGKFDAKIPRDKNNLRGKKRKFESNYKSSDKEKERNMSIFTRLNSDRPLVDSNRAANVEKATKEAKKAAKRKAESDDANETKKNKGKKFNKKNKRNERRGGDDDGFKNKKPKTQKKIRGTSKHSRHKRMKT